MFATLMNSKFHNKCKHAFRCVRTRLVLARRKKLALIRFLKKDMADLLSGGLDVYAFGRMDELVIEMNHAWCYDMIEQFCDYIGKQLKSLQKQRDCPQEAREAVSTLIFAAARFPDLRELCDLRHIFRQRYGDSLEQFVSPEFVRKLDGELFTKEEKFRMMRSIAEEFSVDFDARALEIKLWDTLEMKDVVLEKISSLRQDNFNDNSGRQHCDEPDDKEHMKKSASNLDIGEGNTQDQVHEGNKNGGHHCFNELMAAVELGINGAEKENHTPGRLPRADHTREHASAVFFKDQDEQRAAVKAAGEDHGRRRAGSQCSENSVSVGERAGRLADMDAPRPVSVRTKKPPAAPVAAACGGGGDDGDDVAGRTPSSERGGSGRTKHQAAGRRKGSWYDGDDDYDGFMRRHQAAGEDDSAIAFGNLLPRTSAGGGRGRSSSSSAGARRGGNVDEEERAMDRLLMHYSKKGLLDAGAAAARGRRTGARQWRVHKSPTVAPPGGAVSLPPPPPPPPAGGGLGGLRVPARSTSPPPEYPAAVRVHRKTPEFDELAARVIALRNSS